MQDTKNIKRENEELSEARRFLYELQMNSFRPEDRLHLRTEDTGAEKALQSLRKYCRFHPTNDPEIVSRGEFTYYKKQEEERISRAEKILHRTEPGPFEDPNYFAFLAYQAASIELVFSAFFQEKEEAMEKTFSKVILGTLHLPEVNAFARSFDVPGYTIIALHSGLIDFIYQASKAVVDACNPFRARGGHSVINARGGMETIEENLKHSRSPVDRVWKTLEAYFFKGYPRAFTNETVKDVQIPQLSVLDSQAERWVLAHEYGHSVANSVNLWQTISHRSNSGTEHGQDLLERLRSKENFADLWATLLTVVSAGTFDHYQPEFALSGATFALGCLDILKRSLSILRTGTVSEDTGTIEYPPSKVRIKQNIHIVRQYFDAEYVEGRISRLNFVFREVPPQESWFTSEHAERAYFLTNVLYKIWYSVEEILEKQFRSKRPLHPMWRSG